DGPGYSSILPIEVGGLRQYAQFTAKGVVGVRADDGKFLWRDDSSANGTANCAAPVYADGMLFSASGYGKGGSMLNLSTSGNTTSATMAYHSNDLKVQHGGLVLVDGYVYGSSDSGGLTCIELKTGKKKWNNRSVGKASLTSADGKLFVRDESEGKVAMVRATPAGYQELGRLEQKNRSSSKSWTYPVVFSGKLFLRDQEEMHIYDLK
ncbi:MAG: PQQ-binding-like beta-propeller repeat protein, partial [Planctomycetota bacterium]|nr:PQQ-binding-like beta-propeller repeat protein [Planctomycetota bacterium]